MNITNFVHSLTQISINQVFNPYTDQCPKHDDILSPKIRVANVESYLKQCMDLSHQTAWFGEALGYRGGRRTGLPFSDERHLTDFNQNYEFISRRATISGDIGEVTASVIWSMIDQLKTPPILWNIFPFHPEDTKIMSNRKPTIEELKQTETLTTTFIELFDFTKIYAIGRTAENYLERMGIACTYIRHPSYGGANIFRDQIMNFYDL